MAIYDCFTFFNELDLLDIRLELLNDYIDKFVIVELPYTFRGDRKELVFNKHKERYAKYMDKIVYVCPQNAPQYKGDGDFGIEYFQRNSILEGLSLCNPEDIIIISDIDEIPNPVIFKESFVIKYKRQQFSWKKNIKTLLYEFSVGEKRIVKNIINKKKFTLDEWLEHTPVSLEQDLFYYFMNCRSKGQWYGPVICKYKKINMPQRLRDYRELLPYVEHSGWHFSYLGGVKKVKEKLASIVDKDPAIVQALRESSKNDGYIENCLLSGKDILGRKGDNFEYDFVDVELLNIPGLDKIKVKFPNFFLYKNM